MKAEKRFNAGLLACALIATPAQAALITEAASVQSSVITFDNYLEFITSGPENVGAPLGATVTMTATTPSTLGALIADLGANGTWAAFVDPGSPFAAIGAPGASSIGTMTFTFGDGPQHTVGAFFNTFALAAGEGDIVLTAFGAGNTLLETHTIEISTPETSFNEGAFFGIQRAAPEITALALSGDGFVLDNLAFSAAVPEPATWMMLVPALMLVGFARKGRA